MLPSDSLSGAADRKKVVEYSSVDYKLHRSNDLESLGFEFLHERVGWFRIEDDSIGCEEDTARHDPSAGGDVPHSQFDELILHYL